MQKFFQNFIISVIAIAVHGIYSQAYSSTIPTTPGPDWDLNTLISNYTADGRGALYLTPLDNNLMGESHDIDTGSISFRQVDVSLPGNNHLQVEFARRANAMYYLADGEVHISPVGRYWDVDMPHIVTRVDQGNSANCNATSGISDYFAYETLYIGTKLYIPGLGVRDLGDATPQTPAGFYGARAMATRDLWIATCADTANAAGVVGYVVKAPNGDTYNFDHVKIRPTTFHFERQSGNQQSEFPMDNIYLMPTEITDVNGNWVKYEYNTHGVTRIWSSDGREITLNYSGELISTITANGRQWAYSYNDNKLKRIDLPDTRYWSFGLNEEGMKYNGSSESDCLNERVANGDRILVMKHPSGTVGTFHTDMVVNYVKNIPNKPYTSPVGLGGGSETSCSWGTLSPEVFLTRGLVSKTITLSTGDNYTWSYDYHQPAGSWVTACAQYSYGPGGGFCLRPTKYYFAPSASLDSHVANSLPDEKIRSVIDPLGHKTNYHLNVDWFKENAAMSYISGDRVKVSDVVKKEQFATATSTTPLETTTYHTFEMFAPIGGTAVYQDIIGNAAHTFLPTLKTIERDGDTFTYEYDYNMDPTTSDFAFKRPVQMNVSSNISTTPRVTDTVVYNDRPNWILGLTKSVTQNGRLLATNNYTNLGQFEEQIRYGVSVGKLRYNADGTVDEAEDAIGRITKLTNWKRGKPETIKNAYGTPAEVTIGQTIDNNGWVTATTDAKGQITAYQHDSMGRLTNINPPGSYWVGTSIAYTFPPSGGATQTITKGGSLETVTYDSMYRKTLERSQSTSTGWSSYVNTEYDALGRVVFKSQPSASSTESQGTTTTYDGLGRVKTVTETASGAQTVHSYHSGHRHTIRDPEFNYTHYYSYGYDGPGNNDYRGIYEGNGGRYTIISKNVWGETTQVRQKGHGPNAVDNKDLRQYLYYDSQRRLCRYRTVEGGDTVYQYNNAGEMIAYQKGLSNGSSCATPSGTAKVSMAYDDLGRLELTDFADTATPDIARTYDLNGNLETLYRGTGPNAVNWLYEYNELDLLEKETLSIDGLSFPVDHIYNNRGHIAWKVHPTNTSVGYAPDGLGRATQAKWGATVLADSITYHPSGAVNNISYGNGQTFTQTLNNRLLPDRLLASGNGVTALDLTYTYDQRAKITSILDGAVSGNNRSYTYDALGQMKTATGPWGTQTNEYDTFGNILSREFSTGGTLTRSIDLQYDSKNRVYNSVDSQAVGTGFGNSGTGSRTVAYDSRGNVTTLGTMGFVYDYSDQSTVLNGSLGGTNFNSSSFTYDGNLKRVKSVINGRTIYNVYDSTGSLIHVRKMAYGQDPEERSDYVKAAGKSIARLVRNGASGAHTSYFTFSDHLGSPVATMNGTTGVLETERYTPFGIAMDNPNALTDQAGFTGHIKDSATGLNYMQARYYDPVMGRFLSIDPVTFLQNGNPGYFNRYAYTMNDPINMFDPDGRESWLVSRPLSAPAGIAANHMFVLVRDDATGQVHRFSYGPQGHPTKSPGKLVSHSGTTTKTGEDDAVFARAFLADRKNAESFGVTASPINASDADVITAGNAVNEMLGTPENPGQGAPNYNILPDNAGAASRGDLQANSNSAATAVANIASGSQSQSMPPSSINPGANDQWVISTCKSVNPYGGASSSC